MKGSTGETPKAVEMFRHTTKTAISHTTPGILEFLVGPRTQLLRTTAIELNPNSALSHDRYAQFLETRLRFNQSLAEAQRAEELDPLSPEIDSDVGFVYLFTHRYDESIAQFQKVLDLNPNLPVVRTLRAWAHAMKRMYPQALAEYDKIADQDKTVTAENQFVATGLGWLYAVSGRRADALKIAKGFRDIQGLVLTRLCRFLSSCGNLCGPRRQRRGVPLARKRLRRAFRYYALARYRRVMVRDALRPPLRRPAAPDGSAATRVTLGWSKGIPG